MRPDVATRNLHVDDGCTAGGEVTTVEASRYSTVFEFKDLVLRRLRKDDDEWARRIAIVELMLGEEQLLEDSATLADCGVAPGATVLVVFKQRCVECVLSEDSRYDLKVAGRPALVIVPDGKTIIPDYAFWDCISIERVTLPNSLRNIGSLAFANTGLTCLTIPDTVTSIWPSAFRGCTALTSLTILSPEISLGAGVFDGCTSLMHLTIPTSLCLERDFPDAPKACEVEYLG